LVVGFRLWRRCLNILEAGGERVGRVASFFRDFGDRGGVAVEFAIVAPWFLLLLLAIMELGFMVFVQSVLDDSARSAARLIRTGQVQATSNPQTTFQTQLCNEMTMFVGCSSLLYNVQVFSTWSAATTSITQPGRSAWTASNFGSSTSCEIIAVQVIYNWQFIIPWVSNYLSGGTGSALLTSTVVFQNEPFLPVSSTCAI
jgi:Flp pilus assembly protein TadG